MRTSVCVLNLRPLLDAIKTNLGSNPHEVSADAGYCSTANLRTLSWRRIKGYIATGRQKHAMAQKGAVVFQPLNVPNPSHLRRYLWQAAHAAGRMHAVRTQGQLQRRQAHCSARQYEQVGVRPYGRLSEPECPSPARLSSHATLRRAHMTHQTNVIPLANTRDGLSRNCSITTQAI
jgi:hypothetical protein